MTLSFRADPPMACAQAQSFAGAVNAAAAIRDAWNDTLGTPSVEYDDNSRSTDSVPKNLWRFKSALLANLFSHHFGGSRCVSSEIASYRGECVFVRPALLHRHHEYA